jgi:hypothetical protein
MLRAPTVFEDVVKTMSTLIRLRRESDLERAAENDRDVVYMGN